MDILLIVLALVILYFGAEMALEASEKIGEGLGLSPLVVGLFLVGLGTSLPEFFVSQVASTQKAYPIAIGNILGSNISNMFLILGLVGLLTKINLSVKNIKPQILFHFTLYLVLAGVLYGIKKISLLSSFIFGIFFCGHLIYSYLHMKAQKTDQDAHTKMGRKQFTILIIKICLGFYSLYFGGDVLVTSSIRVCLSFGLSQYVVSVIFVAFGTSLPELVTSLLAIYKKKNSQMIAGNIIGSNIFNVAFIMGTMGIYDISIVETYAYEMIALFGGSLVLIFHSFSKVKFRMVSGIFFILIYIFLVFHWSREITA